MQKYALVTGGSKGIGEAIVKTLSHDGYIVILHYFKDKEKAIAIKKEIESQGRQAYIVQGDLSSVDDIKNIFTHLARITDTLDLVINNAGVYFSYFIEQYPLDKIQYTFNIM